MSDSHKISLLDLQALDLSQYGKKNRDLNQGVRRNTDSSYRKQLSESLSKKPTGSSTDTALERESRSNELNSDQSRIESRNTESRSTTESREDQAPVENQRDARRDEAKSTSEESGVDSSGPGKETTDQQQASEQKNDSRESTEDVVNLQSEVKLPVKEKEQNYSLFNTSFEVSNEGQLDQDVTTVDGEIHPPANFQFVEDQNLVKLQTEVTESGLDESISIPEGLADLLKKQEVQTSQTESVHEIQTLDSIGVEHELNSIEQTQNLDGDGEAQAADSQSLVDLKDVSDLKITDELKQAIQDYQEKNSDNAAGSSDENEINIQGVLQQRYLRSRNEEQSDSGSEQTNEGEVSLDQESVQQISETVIEQIQQEPESEQLDLAEIVDEKSARDLQQAEQKTEGTESLETPNLNPAAETLNRVPVEVSKTAPVSQEGTSSIETDPNLTQTSGVPQSSSTTGTQATAPVGPPVDVKQVEQLVERIVSAVRQSQSTGQQLKIRLSPPELGTLQIEVSLKNGEYSARLEVQNRSAQKVINDNIAQLKEALTKTGVSLDRIDVHINTDSTEDQRSSHSDAQTQSGGDFESNQFSENESSSEERQQEQGFAEEKVRQDDATDQNSPKVSRSQGIVTDNVEEIDVQI